MFTHLFKKSVFAFVALLCCIVFSSCEEDLEFSKVDVQTETQEESSAINTESQVEENIRTNQQDVR